MEYFNHDTAAGVDDKIIALRLECGGAAVDAYWVILEQLYRDETALVFFGNRHLTRSVCHRLAVDEETLKTWVLAMLEIGLLERTVENPDAIHSSRATENINAYRQKAETARQNGKKGGRKPTEKPKANQRGNRTLTDDETQGKANKIKENKGIDTHKGYQIPNAEGVAAAVKTAPPSAQKNCPSCGFTMFRNTQTGRVQCPNGCTAGAA